MAKDYVKLAEEIILHIGGAENITGAVHCTTRLRITLKDESKADEDRIKEAKGVITVVRNSGKFQVVIGNDVPDVYKEFVRSAGITIE